MLILFKFLGVCQKIICQKIIFDKPDSFFEWTDSADTLRHYVMGWQLIWWWWSSIQIYCFHISHDTARKIPTHKSFSHILWKNPRRMTAQNMSNDFNPCITFQWNVIVRNTVYLIVFLRFMFQVLEDLYNGERWQGHMANKHWNIPWY